MSDQRICVILIGGAGAPTTPLPPADLVIAADSGVDLAERIGLEVDLVVGDFDSSTPEAVARAEAGGAEIERHPVDKDATDLELALDAAATRGATRTIVVAGAGSDRIDHVIANASVIAADTHAAIAPEWWVESMVVVPVRGEWFIVGEPGDLVSILPIGGPITVTTEGLQWELATATLSFGSARGMSNRIVTTPVRIAVHTGVALIAHGKDPR